MLSSIGALTWETQALMLVQQVAKHSSFLSLTTKSIERWVARLALARTEVNYSPPNSWIRGTSSSTTTTTTTTP